MTKPAAPTPLQGTKERGQLHTLLPGEEEESGQLQTPSSQGRMQGMERDQTGHSPPFLRGWRRGGGLGQLHPPFFWGAEESASDSPFPGQKMRSGQFPRRKRSNMSEPACHTQPPTQGRRQGEGLLRAATASLPRCPQRWPARTPPQTPILTGTRSSSSFSSSSPDSIAADRPAAPFLLTAAAPGLAGRREPAPPCCACAAALPTRPVVRDSLPPRACAGVRHPPPPTPPVARRRWPLEGGAGRGGAGAAERRLREREPAFWRAERRHSARMGRVRGGSPHTQTSPPAPTPLPSRLSELPAGSERSGSRRGLRGSFCKREVFRMSVVAACFSCDRERFPLFFCASALVEG